jgi:fatty-acid desaturase
VLGWQNPRVARFNTLSARVVGFSIHPGRRLHSTEFLVSSYAKRSLPLPLLVDSRAVQGAYIASFVLIHLLACLIFVPWLFSWSGVVAFFAGVMIFGQVGIPVCYHRQLTHRSFRTAKWLEHSFVVMALCSAQDTPAKWVAWHRKHHNHADEREDPHSPLAGFFWSHIGWLCIQNRSLTTLTFYEKYSRDILVDPFYMYLERNKLAIAWIYLGHAAVYFLVAWGAAFAVLGDNAAAVQWALSVLVWGVFARTVYVWHITWSVNSLSHLFGYRNFETPDTSRNNWLVALITGGEGWHNNHHADQAAATVRCRWWEFDLNYAIIRTLAWLGLATHIIPGRGSREAQRVAHVEDEAAPSAIPAPHFTNSLEPAPQHREAVHNATT